MREKRSLKYTFGLMLTLLLTAGCIATVPEPAATSTLTSPAATLKPTATPTPIPPTATREPTATLTATLTVTRPSTTPAEMPKGPGVEWHLVVISESSGWGLGAAFASQIEKDVGVEVTLEDFAIGNLSAGDVLHELNARPSIPELQGLSSALMDADFVLLFPSPMTSLGLDAFQSFERCFGDAVGIPAPCAPEASEKYTADLEAIWTKVFELRSGKPTILRALDDATPFINRWNENQIFTVCTGCWECYSAAARRAADAFHIPFLSRYDIYNGVDHNIDPGQQGYIGGDGVHPNGLAQAYTAGLLSKLGYEPVTPP